MSNALLNRAWQASCATVSQKVILARLADYANSEGVSWPSQATLARECSMTERSARDAIAALAESGHLTIDKSHGRTAAGHPRYGYRVHPVATPETASPVTPETVSPVEADTGSQFRCDTGNGFHDTGNGFHDTGKKQQRHRKRFPTNHKEPPKNLQRTKGTPPPSGGECSAGDGAVLALEIETPTAPRGITAEDVFKAYPRKDSKHDALLAIESALKGSKKERVTLSFLLRKVEEFAKAYAESGNDPRFIPYCATWVRGRKWEDPLPAPRQPSGSQSKFIPVPPPETPATTTVHETF